MFYDPEEEDGQNADGDMAAKQSAIKAMSKHIGADASGEDDQEDSASDQTEPGEYDSSAGAVPKMQYKRKGKKGGGGGGMGGMMGGGGGGGMDMSSMMGSMGGAGG